MGLELVEERLGQALELRHAQRDRLADHELYVRVNMTVASGAGRTGIREVVVT